jgi:hypothetical protein
VITATEKSVNASELKRLWRTALAILGYLCLVAAGTAVGALLLLGDVRSDDLRRVAALSLLGGALGSCAQGIFGLAELLHEGFELSNGEIHRWGDARRKRAGEAWLQARGLTAPPATRRIEPRDPDDARAERERDDARDFERVQDEADRAGSEVFSLYLVPQLMVLPLMGAALGLGAFSGIVGGFLVASGSNSPSYSPTGLFFVAFLAGLFAENFIAALGRAATALFGDPRSGGEHAAAPPRRGRG